MGTSVESDAVEGGLIQIKPNSTETIVGRFVELVPHSRVVFTWGWLGSLVVPPEFTIVRFEIEAIEAGCKVRIIHTGLVGAAADQHKSGWHHYLGRMAIVVAKGDPGRDPLATVVHLGK